MLDEVTVSNLGLIETAAVEFGSGLTVVSGETGTGKTLMLGALRLIRGENASKDLIGPHADTAEVAAVLMKDDAELFVRRSVGSKGSKAYVDGHVAPARELSDRLGSTIAIVGQHDQHMITSAPGVRRLVDLTLDEDGQKARVAYGTAWQEYQAAVVAQRELGGDPRALERELEVLRFQIDEIDAAGFSVGDEAILRATAIRLRSATELGEDLDRALTAISGDEVSEAIDAAVRSLQRASRIDNDLEPVAERLGEVPGLLSDLAADLQRYADGLGDEAQDMDAVEARLAALSDLKRKYGDSVEDILTFAKDARERADHLEGVLHGAADVEERIRESHRALVEAGAQLTSERRSAAEILSSEAVSHLRDLGFTDPIVRIAVEPTEPREHGSDHVEVRFASDSVLEPGPVASIASGGELSRLVLALTVAAGGADAEVVAFDEIDAGIGGATALAMGEKLKRLADGRQVICVTHLPQVAAHGDHHLVVRREGTVTSVESVEGEQRTAEIARMLAGLGDSKLGHKHAEELLQRAADVVRDR